MSDSDYEDSIPPLNMYKFGKYEIDTDYRQELYEEYPFYTGEEIVGTYLGHNPYFPSQEEWFLNKYESDSECN